MRSLVPFTFLYSVFSVVAVALVAPLVNLIFVGNHVVSPIDLDIDDRSIALVGLCIAIGSAFLAKNVWYVLAVSAQSRFQTGLSSRKRKDLLDHILRQPYTFFLSSETSVLTSTAVQTVQRIAENHTRVVSDLARVLPLLVGYLTILLWLNGVLVLLLAAVIPLLGLLNSLSGRVARRMAVTEELAGGRLHQRIQQTLQHIRLTKLFNIEDHQAHQLGHAGKDWLRHLRKRALISAWFLGGLEMAGVLTGLALLFLIGEQTIQGYFRHGPGGFVLFVAAAFSLIDPVKDLMRAFSVRSETERLEELLAAFKPGDRVTSVRHSLFEKDLRFENVCYQYPESRTPAISEVSCTIRPGDHIGLFGTSGVGKSTFGLLMAGLLQPTTGSVLIDGIPTSSLDGSSRAAIFGVIAQEVAVFGGSLRDNLMLGLDLPQAVLEDALEQAGLGAWYRDQPKGLDTVLGEDGKTLSGGERQRLAIARLLLRDPKIIFLDEPTSGMDAQTEKFVLSRLFSCFRERTIVVVSHRPTVLEYVGTWWHLEKTGLTCHDLSFRADLPIVHEIRKES